MRDTVKYDAVGMGSYNIDVREMQRSYLTISRFPDMKHEVYNEGYLSIPVAQYEIPYRALIPKFEECRNLIVPVCLSGSHLAIASIRMEPQYMILGQSAGVAAAMAVASSRAVQQVDVFELGKKLVAQNQVLSLKGNPYGLWNNENEIILDNNMKGYTFFTGDWREEETVHTGRYEMNFRYKPANATGTFEYSPYLFKDGNYNVYVWYPASKEYAASVPVVVNHANGADKRTINQQQDGGKWLKIGTYPFRKGQKLALTIEGEAGKFVVADAVKFERVQ
jgi:hypothetical protein